MTFVSSRFHLLLSLGLLAVTMVVSFQPHSLSSLSLRSSSFSTTSSSSPSTATIFRSVATRPPTNENESSSKATTTTTTTSPEVIEETTEKFGLEAGLFQSLRQKDGGESAKSLLKKYGIAYLATSIPLAAISFIICYVLVDNGVDVAALLEGVGIESSGAADKAGTFALAYAAHKAASPIRFPPTVILTPVVAKLIGKEPDETGADEEDLAKKSP